MQDHTRKFDGLADLYDASRPTYPPDVLTAIAHAVAAGDVPPRCLDVGAGTGISTRALIDVLPGWTVQAVEPNLDMAARAGAAGLEVIIAPAEALPIEANSVGLVTVAQAFHWFDRPRFLREARRVLSQNGVLAVINNNRRTEEFEALMAVEDFIEAENPDYSRHYRDLDIAAEIEASGRFGEIQRFGFAWALPATAENLVRYFLSRSSSSPIAARLGTAMVMRRIVATIERHEAKPTFDVPMMCDLVVAHVR
ncbi:class I SAM-dependent methyltransferase [Bradyrhizobium oligotrophicum]|uniref:class I SAM-dependent methyltransferase n=1 Tax=Bradyrhizobium oligotrophicum TaxID=44255 RepID=UPI003EB7F2F8